MSDNDPNAGRLGYNENYSKPIREIHAPVSRQKCAPYVLACLGAAYPKELTEAMRKVYPDSKSQLIYRYLQIYRARGWLTRNADNTWSPTHSGLNIMRQLVKRFGWPSRLLRAGFSADQMHISERAAPAFDDFVPVDEDLKPIQTEDEDPTEP